ncbi:MAG: hypothetical protein IKP28_01700 [Clostridia bacterium]|nr:hypothetical protein [Clostridia bacterium]
MKLFERALLGLVIAEFVMVLFFLVVSICVGELVFSTFVSGRGLLYDLTTNFAFFAVIGYVFGIAAHVYIEKKENGMSGKKELGFVMWMFLVMFFTVLLVFTVKGISIGITDFAHVIVSGTAIFILLSLLFAAAYFLVSPVLDKLDKKCVKEVRVSK